MDQDALGEQTNDAAMRRALRGLPRVDDLLADPRIAAQCQDVPRVIARDAVRDAIDQERDAIRAGKAPSTSDELAQRSAALVRRASLLHLRSAVNATGVVIHTNLGRSPLSARAAQHVADVSTHYSTLEFDVEAGARGSRHNLVSELLSRLTGAEDACVVNNNASAVLIVLSELGRDKEVIVSRGELIEIGGSFRIPDIMELSGAKMVEVGTTNKTHLQDFERAITEETSLVLKVHPSNYRIMGFHEEVSAQDLAALAHERGIVVYEDQGSGMLADLTQAGIASDEHTAGWSLAQGVDLVSCSGDKLLGSGQAGIILGSAELVGRIKKNPLMRAVRPDKMTLAALEYTLRDYLDPDAAWREVPVLRMLSAPIAELKARAQDLLERLLAIPGGLAPDARAEALATTSFVGGGALPTTELPTWAVRVRRAGVGANELRSRLIQLPARPVVTRVEEDWVVCDVRTLVDERDEQDLIDALAIQLGASGAPDKE